jgi:hypothetical protein
MIIINTNEMKLKQRSVFLYSAKVLQNILQTTYHEIGTFSLHSTNKAITLHSI